MTILRIIIIFFLFQVKSYSLIEVDITRGNLNPLPIAVSPLATDKDSKQKFKNEVKVDDLGAEISKVVENNLMTSGLFNPLPKDSFLQEPDIAHFKPRFEDWKLIKAQALITGKVEYSTFPVINACALISFQSSNLGLKCAISGSCRNESFGRGLNNPDVIKLFSTTFEISAPRSSTLTSFLNFCLESLSVASGETAIGKGFRFPLVISTSIKE